METAITPLTVLEDAIEQINQLKTPADRLNEARIRATDKPAPPDILLTFQGNVIGSLGDFTLLTGKAKSRKSLLISMITAAYLRGGGIDGLEFNRYAGKNRVLIFDTEQGRYHANNGLIRGIKRAGIGLDSKEAGQVELYCLRPYTPAERIELIEEAVIRQNEAKNICLVIIDGIRDLVTDINSPDEATKIATKLMKWTEEQHLHIITVLHQNKGDTNARGHVGTELVNKAETVISVEVSKDNKDVSNVNPEMTRNQPFEPFSIYFDLDGLPQIGEFTAEERQAGRKATTPHSFDLTVHKVLIKGIFSRQEAYTYTELINAVKVAFSSISVPMGDNKAKEMITHWQNETFVSKIGKDGMRGVKYVLGSN